MDPVAAGLRLNELVYALDERAAAVLVALHRRGGTATMADLVSETEFGRGELYHLLGDLGTLDLVSTTRKPAGRSERTATLTRAGETAIEAGLLEEFEGVGEREDAAAAIRRLSHRLEGLIHR